MHLRDGNRQEINKNGELSILYFDTLMIKISSSNDNVERDTSLQEKSLKDLFFPKEETKANLKRKMLSEASNRIIWPFYDLIFALLAIYAILQGEYNRVGKTKRIILFSGIAGIITTLHFCLINLGSSYIIATYFCYIFAILIFAVLSYLLFIRLEK